MRIGSLFSGIGGLELGLERAGLGHTVWQVEREPFCRSILARHWPSAQRYEDVKEIGIHCLEPVDLICGGFPCQDVSSAGKGAGLSGERSGLWFEFARIVGELRPEWVIVENVASGAKRWVDAVCAGLGELGYETLPIPITAQGVGAPHRRARVFIVAHTERIELRQQSGRGSRAHGQGAILPTVDGKIGASAHTDSQSQSAIALDAQMGRVPTTPRPSGWSGRIPEPVLRGVDDGSPDWVDRTSRLKALGNGVVPQCAEVVGWVVRELIGINKSVTT